MRISRATFIFLPATLFFSLFLAPIQCLDYPPSLPEPQRFPQSNQQRAFENRNGGEAHNYYEANPTVTNGQNNQDGTSYMAGQTSSMNRSQPNQQWQSPVLPPTNPSINGEGGSVLVTVQLKSYSNPGHRLDSQRLCTCPNILQSKCVENSPTRTGYSCLVSFTVIVTSADGLPQYNLTDYMLLAPNGQIAPDYSQKLQNVFTFELEHQPRAIDVFVNHLGAVINEATGVVEQPSTGFHIDTFIKSLDDVLPSSSLVSVGGGFGNGFNSQQQQQQATLSGTKLGNLNQLSLAYSVSCRGRLIGAGCDLSCNSSQVNSGSAICVNAKTGFYSLCRWTNSKTQVTDCLNCPWGIKENAYCMDEKGGVLDQGHAGVVSSGFQTATISLTIICALLLICLVGSCLYSRKRSRKPASSSPAPGYNANNSTYHSGYRTHTGDPESTALNGHRPNNSSAPMPVPRVNNGGHHFLPPPLGNKLPNKSSMRSPLLYQLPPPAHLGGSNSLNDTMNTSFTGSQVPPIPPSVSADV